MSTAPDELTTIDGYASVIDHFGAWPGFHDAELVDLQIQLDGRATVSVHIFQVLTELTPSGFYRTAKHAVVHFRLRGLRHVELVDEALGWSTLFGLRLRKIEESYELHLDQTAGLGGILNFDSVVLVLEPGIPPGSQYEQTV